MNIIVIVTDSLRFDHVGCYGSDVKTPNIDRLAKEGIRLSNAYSENLPTLPTRRAWWTGRYHFHQAGWQPFLEADDLLAEILWNQGYTSALITDVYHMHKPSYNCGRGFDTTVFIRGQEYDPWIVDPGVRVSVEDSPVHRIRETDSPENIRIWKKHFEQYLRNCTVRRGEEDYYAPQVAKEAIRWLEHITKKRKDRLFLWVDMFDPHEPWDPPAPFHEMYADSAYAGPNLVDPMPGEVEGYMTPEEVQNTKNLYAGEVTFVDKWVGILLDRIRDLGIDENTLIMHTTDHGEPFGEHGHIRKARPHCYEELVHIPWIIRLPNRKSAGREIDALVQTVDLFPTVLEALGIDPESIGLDGFKADGAADERRRRPSGSTFGDSIPPLTGQSLMPLLKGKVDSVRETVFGAYYGREWYIRSREWTYRLPLASPDRPSLYHRPSDPGENADLAEEHPDVANGLELALRRFVEDLVLLS
jgi:arylsulfatase A-like enzyme